MKINGNELRTGNIVEYQGRLMRAAKVHIVQMGNWRSFLQVELRDIRDGTKLNERIRPADTIERVQLDEKHYQFLYKEGDQYTFMDNETYDQISRRGGSHRRAGGLPPGGHAGLGPEL